MDDSIDILVENENENIVSARKSWTTFFTVSRMLICSVFVIALVITICAFQWRSLELLLHKNSEKIEELEVAIKQVDSRRRDFNPWKDLIDETRKERSNFVTVTPPLEYTPIPTDSRESDINETLLCNHGKFLTAKALKGSVKNKWLQKKRIRTDKNKH